MPFFFSSPRGSRSPLLRRAPRLARLRRRLPAGSNPHIARSTRLMRPLSAVAALLLAGLLVRGWTAWRFNVAQQIEEAARQQYIPQLEKQFGQKIEVGKFSTDWLGRVQIENIVVGRDARLPTGALMSAKTATITLDLFGLAMGRAKFPGAISAVDLDSPRVYVRRDARGKLNLASLFKSSSGGRGTRWSGRIGFQNARAFYADDKISDRRRQRLELDARGASGTVRISSPRAQSSAFEFEARPNQLLLRGQNLGAFPVRGRVVSADKTPTRGWIETRSPALPAPLLSQWARLPVEVRSGTFGGAFQLAFVGTELSPRGDAQLQNVALTVSRRGARPVSITSLSGPLHFAGTALQTPGVSARALGANWTASGRAAFDRKETVFDGNFAVRALRLADVRGVLGASIVPPNVNARALDIDAHASGTPAALHADGTIEARGALWNDKTRSATFSLLRASGALSRVRNAPLAFAARFEARGGEVRAPIPRAQNVMVRAQNWSGSLRSEGRALDFNARADKLSASSPVLGTSSAAGVRVVASTRDFARDWRGQLELSRVSTAQLRLSSLFSRASLIERSGLVSARLNFEGAPARWEQARASGALSLSDLSVSPAIVPASARPQIARVFGANFDMRSLLSARNLGAEVSLRNGVINIARAQAQTAVGPATASFSTPLRAFAPRFAFALPQLRVPRALLLDVARARGLDATGDWNATGTLAGSGDARRTALRAVLSLDATRFAVQSTGARARSAARAGFEGSGAHLRVAADLSALSGGAQQAAPRWSAQLMCNSLQARPGVLGATGLVIPPALNGARIAGAQIVATSRNGVARSNRARNGARDVAAFRGEIARVKGVQNAAWTMEVRARSAALAVAGLENRPVVTLRDLSALLNPRAGGVDSRIGARFGDSGRVDGALSLGENGISGEVLAREVEAQSLQLLLARTSQKSARLQGRLNFKATFRPDESPRIETQMARGRLLIGAPSRVSALAIRLLSVETRVENGAVRLRNVRALVNEARLEGQGSAGLNTGRIESHFDVAGLSLAPFARLAGAPGAFPVAGLARAGLDLSFDSRRGDLKVGGRVHLDGGAYRGVSLDGSDAQIDASWNTREGAGALKMSSWHGELEGSPFSGNVSLDTRANAWSVQLSAPKIALQRAARLKARLQNAGASDSVLTRLAPPVSGTASAVLDVGGTLRDGANRWVFRPQTGLARLNVPDLKWRAATLGELDGTFKFSDGRLAFEPLRLSPPEDESGRAPTLSLVGSVPLDARSGPLDARLSVGEAPLDFFLETLQEGRDALVSSDISSPFLESVVRYGANLPRGLQGRVALEAQVGGTFSAPVFKVSRLALRDGRAPLPLGGLSLPATADAAFTFSGGEVAFDRAEFRLAKTERGADGTPVAGAAPPDPNPDAGAGDEADDTLVQVQPDSKLSLEGDSSVVADVFNANLSQLAPWVPALRGKNGETLLRGQLEGFSVSIKGPASDPRLTASVDAQNISFRGVTVERLRVARLDIGDGVAKIEPGNLSVKEGRYESSAASGSVAWSWKTGPVADGPIKVQIPFATRDFGALAALFVPGISGARADEFAGLLDVSGTVRAPQFRGDVRIKDASFQTVSTAPSPLAVGVQHLSGALRFVDGNRIEIDADNPVAGELVAPETVAIASPTPVPAPTTAAAAAGKAKKTKAKVAKSVEDNAFRARGAFKVRGSVALGRSDLLQLGADVPATIASNIYDLRLDVSGARVDAPGISGVQDAALSATFRSENPGDAAHSQTVRWIGAGRGVAASKKIGAGDVFSRGAFRLRSDFAAGFSSLARSTPLAWNGADGGLAASEGAGRAPDSSFEDARPQLVFKGFSAKASGYGSAVVDGTLVLDKARAQNRAPDAARLQTIAGAPSLRPFEPVQGARLFGAWNQPVRAFPSAFRGSVLPREIQRDGGDDMGGAADLPVRLGGNIVVSSAQIVGGGAGDGQVTRLSLLPDAPRLDVRLSLGRDVELVNSTVRARLSGDVALSGTPSSPLLLGTVEVLDGQVRFPNARARIEDGRVSINVSRDAETDLPRTRLEVDATARGQAGRYAITLRLRGPLQFDARDSQNTSNLRIEVTSNPALSQDEAFAQLLGVLPRDYANENGGVNVAQANQAYAQAVLQLVSAPFFSGFERSVAQALGLSSVSFEYRFNEPLAFEVSKALGDRILITYRRSLGATTISDGRTPYGLRVDYRLKGEFYLGLQLDERQIKTLTLNRTWRF